MIAGGEFTKNLMPQTIKETAKMLALKSDWRANELEEFSDCLFFLLLSDSRIMIASLMLSSLSLFCAVHNSEMKTFQIKKEHDYIILGCDGIYDKMSN